jgi:N-carbamoyl-L-amino-acid hydrolase
MARIAPTAMVFIPCRDGVSHRPDEYSSPEAIAQGTLVLAETLAELTQS